MNVIINKRNGKTLSSSITLIEITNSKGEETVYVSGTRMKEDGSLIFSGHQYVHYFV